MPVNEKECQVCKFEKECAYLHGDNNENFTELIANSDGSCMYRQLQESIKLKS